MKPRWIFSLVCIGLAGLLAFPVAQADGDDSASLVGTWRITVSDPFGGGFFSLLTAHADNTLLERPSTSTSVSVGVGVWEAIGDDDSDSDSDSDSSDYAATFDTFTDDDADTFFDTRLRIRLTLQVEDDTVTGTGTVDVFSLDNSLLLFSIPGAILEGTRMTVVPE